MSKVTLSFPRQQPVSDPSADRPLCAADQHVVSRMANWIEGRLGDGADCLTRQELAQAGFTAAQVDLFFETAFAAARARLESRREAVA